MKKHARTSMGQCDPIPYCVIQNGIPALNKKVPVFWYTTNHNLTIHHLRRLFLCSWSKLRWMDICLAVLFWVYACSGCWHHYIVNLISFLMIESRVRLWVYQADKWTAHPLRSNLSCAKAGVHLPLGNNHVEGQRLFRRARFVVCLCKHPMVILIR